MRRVDSQETGSSAEFFTNNIGGVKLESKESEWIIYLRGL